MDKNRLSSTMNLLGGISSTMNLLGGIVHAKMHSCELYV